MQEQNFFNFKLYTKDKCSYCEKAKSLLTAYGLPFDIIDTEDLGQLKQKYDQSTYPFIFIEKNSSGIVLKEFLGGYSELKYFLSKNLLIL
jgi:glutaredoxin